MKKIFNWGSIAQNKWFHRVVYQEIFIDNVYQRFFSVDAGDVVVDIGASVGPFTYSILKQNPSVIYCLEPHKDLYKTLIDNLTDSPIPIITDNKGMSSANGSNGIAGLFKENETALDDGKSLVTVETVKFSTFVNENNITQIDFLKTDSEGAEYDIFNDENFYWIKKNVRKIAGEFHLHTPDLKKKFRHFRDTYLKEFKNHQVLSLDYTDIKSTVWEEWFIERYNTINVYIDNRQRTIEIKKWQHYPAPTMEITTVIPEKGCVVDCAFCPQRVLEKVYTGTRILTLDNFKKLVDRIPTDVRITFAGFTEPWMNKYCTDMVLYAHEQGHPVSVFTTGVGLSVEDMERIVDIPYHGDPNGGFTLHLPDAEQLARHPITPGFIRTMEWFKENNHRIKNFGTMSMGDVHPSVRHLFDWAPKFEMWSRAGNLVRESLLRPEIINLKNRWNAVYHTDKNRTCGCVEHLYHNVLLPNGDISLCCMDYGLDHILGNLYTQTYEEIIPKVQSCFDLCNYCENGITPKP